MNQQPRRSQRGPWIAAALSALIAALVAVPIGVGIVVTRGGGHTEDGTPKDRCQGLDALTDVERAQQGCYISGPIAKATHEAYAVALRTTTACVFVDVSVISRHTYENAKSCHREAEFKTAADKAAQSWLANLQAKDAPGGAAEAIRPAVLAWFETGAEDPTSENQVIQTALLWKAANQPVVVGGGSIETDDLRRQIDDLRTCIELNDSLC